MSNPRREIDKTFLSLDLAEERMLHHRDYLAHVLRWSHVVRHMGRSQRYKESIVLDVGCGKEMPLAKLLYSNRMSPMKYIGVDANKFSIPEMLPEHKFPITIWPETDFCALEPEDVGTKLIDEKDPEGPGYSDYALPNVLVCFEVLEHVMPEHCRRMLKRFGDLTSPDVDMFISTPCWNGSAAQNHINEMTFAALGSLIEDLGYSVEGVYGTFASIGDYMDQLQTVTTYDKSTGQKYETDLRHVFSVLRNYYDTNVLSVIFAPLFPAYSRNCLWHIKKKKGDALGQQRLFSALESAPTPWSQHPRWRELAELTVEVNA